MMRESKIEKALRLGVEALGGTCEKFTTPGKRGTPDRLVCWEAGCDQSRELTGSGWSPAVEFIETKAPLGVLKSWQARDHERRRAIGFNVEVLGGLGEVESYLKRRGKK